MSITPEQLDEIEKLAAAATPGPYQVASVYPAYGVFRVEVDEPSECVAMCAVSMNEDADEAHVERQEAHARNAANARAIAALLKYALPLVKALREARAKCVELQAIIDRYERKDGPTFQAHLGEAKAMWAQAAAEKERDDARAEVERLREMLREAVAERAEDAADLSTSRRANGRIIKERDEARAEVERLTHNLVQTERHAQLVEKSLADSQAAIERRTDWYQQRFNALRPWVENEVAPLSPEVAKRYWNIVANGSPSPHESADWAGTLHAAKVGAHVAGVRADNAERREAHLKTELDEARAEVERLREAVRKVRALAESAERDYRALEPILNKLREINKITKGMVE